MVFIFLQRIQFKRITLPITSLCWKIKLPQEYSGSWRTRSSAATALLQRCFSPTLSFSPTHSLFCSLPCAQRSFNAVCFDSRFARLSAIRKFVSPRQLNSAGGISPRVVTSHVQLAERGALTSPPPPFRTTLVGLHTQEWLTALTCSTSHIVLLFFFITEPRDLGHKYFPEWSEWSEVRCPFQILGLPIGGNSHWNGTQWFGDRKVIEIPEFCGLRLISIYGAFCIWLWFPKCASIRPKANEIGTGRNSEMLWNFLIRNNIILI